VLKC
jgi:hypothetical protein